MFTKKFIALATLLSLLTVWIPIARAEDIDHDGEEDGFVELKAGEVAQEEGFFFNHSALSQLIAKQESKLALLTNSKDTEYKKLQLDLETLSKKKDLELTINKDMYESLLKIKLRIDRLRALS